MSDSIPVTTHLAMALIDYVCARRDCEKILQTFQLEQYIDKQLAFDRGAPGDGIVTLKVDGKDTFVMDEIGKISSLDGEKEYSFQVKVMIAGLFGKEELKQATLTAKGEEDAKILRAAMGLGAPPTLKVASSDPAAMEEPKPPPVGSGTFLYDRWKGWRLGGELIFNYFQGPGGGAKLWLGLRQERWDFRIGFHGESIRKKEEADDLGIGLTLEPIFHLRESPLIFDPYLHLPSLGFYHLLEEKASGITFVPLGGGLQFHLHDAWSIYAGARGVAKLGFETKPAVGLEVPLGFSGKF